MKSLIFLFAIVLLLVGCTSTVENNTNEYVPEPADDVTIANEDDNSLVAEGDVTIVINNARLDPSEVIIPFGEESTIVIENQEDTTQRVDIALYQSEVSVDVAPGTYEVVILSPKVKGRVLIDLNGASVGTLVVE